MARSSKVAKKGHGRKARPTDKGRVRRGRPKVCVFCAQHVEWVDYKDINVLRRFVNDRGRIKARGATGTCAQHQRDVAVAIKTARELALLPYAVRTMAADAGDRRGGQRGSRASSSAGASEARETDDADSDGADEGDSAADIDGDSADDAVGSASSDGVGAEDLPSSSSRTAAAT